MAKPPKSFKTLAFVASEKPAAKEALKDLSQKYGNHDAASADLIIALGGDGFMLQTLRTYMPLIRRGLPVYGMNKGLSLIHISEPTRPRLISYAVFCLKKKK